VIRSSVNAGELVGAGAMNGESVGSPAKAGIIRNQHVLSQPVTLGFCLRKLDKIMC
jgi:hypothetical protein